MKLDRSFSDEELTQYLDRQLVAAFSAKPDDAYSLKNRLSSLPEYKELTRRYGFTGCETDPTNNQIACLMLKTLLYMKANLRIKNLSSHDIFRLRESVRNTMQQVAKTRDEKMISSMSAEAAYRFLWEHYGFHFDDVYNFAFSCDENDGPIPLHEEMLSRMMTRIQEGESAYHDT